MSNILTRKRKEAGELREILAQNINRLMESRYREESNRSMKLAKDSGMSLSNVQRILSRQQGASIDKVEALAKAFGLPPFQLLVPWGLLGEIAKPQAIAPRRALFVGEAKNTRSASSAFKHKQRN